MAWPRKSARFFLPAMHLFFFFLKVTPCFTTSSSVGGGVRPLVPELAERAAMVGRGSVVYSAAEARKETLTVLRNGAWMTLCAPKRQAGTDIESVFAHGWLRSSAAFTG